MPTNEELPRSHGWGKHDDVKLKVERTIWTADGPVLVSEEEYEERRQAFEESWNDQSLAVNPTGNPYKRS